MTSPNFHLLVPKPSLEAAVRSWLAEDIPSFDIGGAVVGAKPAAATLFIKSDGVLAGVPFFDQVFELLGCK